MKPLLCLLLLFFLRFGNASIQLLEEEDATKLIDLVLDLFKESSSPQISISSFTFKVGSFNNHFFGNWSGSTGWVGDFQSLRRVSPVVTSNSGNNLTLSTSFSFEELWGSWYRTELTFLGLKMIGDISLTFNQNEFNLELNVFKEPRTRKCEVGIQKAGFSFLSDIDIDFRPIGFFNKFNMDATLTHLNQAILQQMNLLDFSHLGHFLQQNICSSIPN